jgi:hypothetical protein
MTLKLLALALAVVLSVPASLALLRPGRAGDSPGEPVPRRPLDALWAVVPIVLLVALIVFSAVA